MEEMLSYVIKDLLAITCKECKMAESEHTKQSVQLPSWGAWVLALIIVLAIIVQAIRTSNLSRSISEVKSYLNNELHTEIQDVNDQVYKIEKRLNELQVNVSKINTNVDEMQREITILTQNIQSFLKSIPRDWDEYRKQIRNDVRDEIRNELGQSRASDPNN